jgi:excisionase family DNA binding protein
MDDELLTVRQAATRLKMHPDTVRRLLRENEIPGLKLGKRQWRVPSNVLEEFIEGRLQPIGRTFDQFAQQWRDETQFMSSITDIVMHPAYQRIVGMGPAVIPYLLRELERRPEQWFWALRAITGADPVTPEERGKVRAMAEAWLRWGRDHGFN